ncbi:MAG: alpha/beta fold hydrolase [Halobacteriaceae archaeon]
MPRVDRDGASLYYEATSDGPEEVVAFVAEAGLGAWSWGWQHRAVAGPHDAVVFDARGTGRSTADPSDEWDTETFAADLDAVLADAGVRRAHLVGLGVGGMVALHHALTRGRAASVALFGTAARFGAVDRAALTDFLDGALERGLSPQFVADRPEVADQIREWRGAEDAPEDVWRAQVAAVDDFDVRDRLHEVTVPSLVCHGTGDDVVPVEAGEALASGLPRGEAVAFDGGGHLVTVERSRPLNDALLAHLDSATE